MFESNEKFWNKEVDEFKTRILLARENLRFVGDTK